MDHELAIKLKEAGFPQNEVRFKGTEAIRDMLGPYEPTLEELIEACKGLYLTLEKDEYGYWTAKSNDGEEYIGYSTGSNPSEAVAKLWLALNL
jgi:hypothetical protein